MHKKVEASGVKCAAAGVTALPLSITPVAGADSAAVSRLLEAIEEHDDVKEVYSNAEIAA